jgi:hypothetical protein
MGGSFTPNEFSDILPLISFFKDIQVFIETGTHFGTTSYLASLIFNEVFTFEINKIFYEFSKRKYHLCNNINFWLGDSVTLLDQLLDKEKRPAFFFLDAHHHHITTTEDIKMNNGSNSTPLMDELNSINNKYPKVNAVICIDDVRLWRNANKDWANVTDDNIIQSLNKHTITNIFEHNDRLYIIINN